MQGVRLLREALRSSITVAEIDVDACFGFGPGADFGLAVALGVLYHLKNPIQFMETLSHHSRYCLLSTRIMDFLPGGRVSVRDLSVAYLVDEDEVNSDNSNFWILTETGLRRLLRRSNWQIISFTKVGGCSDSDPVRPDRDERAFCLVESRSGMKHIPLKYGLHEPEDQGWRWSEHKFGFALPLTDSGSVRLNFYLPDELFSVAPELRLSCRANGEPLQEAVYSGPGLHSYVSRISRVPGQASVQLDFQTSHALPPDQTDPRERALVVADIGFLPS